MTAEEFRAFCQRKKKGAKAKPTPSRDPGDETEQPPQNFADRLQQSLNEKRRASSPHQTQEQR